MQIFENVGLERVLQFATNAHQGQKRKYSDEDYITHPIEVAKRVNYKHGSELMTAAALLHDVLEDTKVTHSELRMFLHTVFSVEVAEKVLSLVVELTDVYTHKDFPNYNRKMRKQLEALRLFYVSNQAKKIKLADIEHNSESIEKHDPKFAKVFLEEKKQLLEYLEK
tara:strand:- start:86 stop:586 length:501 start_codon:yes stop_codon:yes gene_type:complete